jgi:pimeloyl-CoA synthetase
VGTRTVPAVNINVLLSRFSHTKGPDFLNIDVEGVDEKVLYAIDFDRYTPRSICIETGVFMDLSRDKKKRIDTFLFKLGYEVVFYNTNNTIYVLSSHWNNYMKSLGVKLA